MHQLVPNKQHSKPPEEEYVTHNHHINPSPPKYNNHPYLHPHLEYPKPPLYILKDPAHFPINTILNNRSCKYKTITKLWKYLHPIYVDENSQRKQYITNGYHKRIFFMEQSTHHKSQHPTINTILYVKTTPSLHQHTTN